MAATSAVLAGSRRQQDVLVVEEHELIQAGLHALLAREPWVANCYSATSAEIAWQLALQHHPQLVVISMSLPLPTGFELCNEIVHRIRGVRLVLLSADADVATSAALAHGVVPVVPKWLPSALLLEEVRRVANERHATRKESVAVRLSKRERDVLQHLALGLTNSEMAQMMNLSRWTVKQYTSALYRKLGVRNRTQAARHAQEFGIARV
ncbi:response regulator transcription factor [Nocardia spumae]|uniref:response regulator transcription factor n=1 Tax=Nocardia spumae TaxID=2887190 RepID=UPI001D13ACFD|nr:response regulator transcription factor [Nocardia spumae]